MNTTVKIKKPFPIAAIMFFAYVVMSLVAKAVTKLVEPYTGASNDFILFYLVFVTVGILMLALRKVNIAYPILFAIPWLKTLVETFIALGHFFNYPKILPLVRYIACCMLNLTYLALVGLGLAAFICRKKKCKLLKLWFLPTVFYLINRLLVEIYNLVPRIAMSNFIRAIYPSLANTLPTLLLGAAFLFFGLWLYKMNSLNGTAVPVASEPEGKEFNLEDLQDMFDRK